MEDVLSSNNLENESLRALFQKDLKAIRGLYSEEILNLVENNIDILLKDYIAWQKAIMATARSLGVEDNNVSEIPNMIEQATFERVKKILSEVRTEKIVLGIAGPGAVGKETIKDALGFDAVVNTTTRPKRDYEKEAQHYNFIDDTQFKSIVAQDGFIVSMERPGRGQYGIQKKDIEKVLGKYKISIVEENPANLTKLSEYIQKREGCEFIIVYILPPYPVLPHLAARLAGRCQKTGSDFRSAIASTLGIRQLNEFVSVLDSMEKGNNVIFVVNDSVDRAVGKIKDLVK